MYLSFVNAWLFVVGSVCFIPASTFFHPTFSSDAQLYLWAVWLFIIGSCCFSIASLQSIITAVVTSCLSRRQINADELISLHLGDLDLEDVNCPLWYSKWKDCLLPLFTSWLSFQGGCLFIIGSVAFLPEYGSDGSLLGNWLYRFGSCSYIISNSTALFFAVIDQVYPPKGHGLMNQDKPPPVAWYLNLSLLICFLCGAILFLIGGVFFYKDIGAPGSIAWAIGSAFFLAGSTIYLLLVCTAPPHNKS